MVSKKIPKPSKRALPPVKRPKTQTVKTDGDILLPTGPSLFLRLPSDILFEIFKWTHPVTLLQLARTNKALRNDLMSKSATKTWESARANELDFLPCPSYLSEPRWVAFSMDECMICESKNAGITSLEMGLRLCWSCKERKFLPASKLRLRSRGGVRSCLNDILALVQRAQEFSYDPWTYHHQEPPTLYYIPEVEHVGKEFMEWKAQIKLGTPGAEAGFTQFIESRNAYLAAAPSPAKLCDSIKAAKAKTLQDMFDGFGW
ncbi:hypothetical protein FRB96_006857 [Tulasnella sp. 330]|nr:hypothetical protein FRB96_006857 [Tulasnella sp. 330]KAG8884543.1 hypothetical protein FRB98_002330 [Tulasnella sp. 332]